MGWGGARPGAGRPRKPVSVATPSASPARQAQQPKQLSFLPSITAVSQVLEAARGRRGLAMDRNPFRPNKNAHPARAIPPDQKMQIAMDEASTEWASNQWALNAMNGAAIEGQMFLGYPYLSELAQRPEYRVPTETIATEMTRKWIKFTAVGDKDKTDRIKELVDFLDALKVRDHYKQVVEHDGFFGRSHLYHGIKGADDDPEELKAPLGDGRSTLSKSKVSPKRPLSRLQVIEPVWCYPTTYNATNPLAPDWYNPQVWYVMGKEIHASRLMPFIGRPVPDLLKPAYSFGGLSLSQMVKPYVDIWLQTRESVAALIHAFSVMVLKTDMQSMLQPSGADNLLARTTLFNTARDNMGLMLVNKDTEELTNVSAPLSGLEGLQAQSQEHMFSVTRIPAVKYAGIQPTGLNASSEGEIRVFYDTISAYQQQFMRPNLTKTIDFAMLSLWGEVDQDIVFAFETLWELNEKEKSEARKADAETASIHIQDGVISPAEERARLVADPDGLYQGLNPDDLPEPPPDETDPTGGMDPEATGEPGDEPDGDPGPEDTGTRGTGPAKPQGAKPTKPSGGRGADAAIPFAADDASWEETKHPCDKGGKFTSGGGGGTSGTGKASGPSGAAKTKAAVSKAIGLLSNGTPVTLHLSDAVKVGSQKGSNPGGVYETNSGQFYVKVLKSPKQVRNELTAAALYAVAGVPTLEYRKTADASTIASKMENLEADNVSKLTPAQKKEAQSQFAVHAWLANWDAAGTGGDNVGVANGKVLPLDVGGSLEYRAQGEPKGAAFGPKVTEFASMRDPAISPDAAKLFADMSKGQLRDSVEKVTSLSDQQITDAVKLSGGSEALAKTLIARKDDLAAALGAIDPEWAAQHPRGPDGRFMKSSNFDPAALENFKLDDKPAASKSSAAAAGPVFKSKKDHAKHLLTQEAGVTTKQMLQALQWPSISMPAMAKSLGLALEKTKVNGEWVYKAKPMTAEQQTQAKADIAKALQAAAPKPAEAKTSVPVPPGETVQAAIKAAEPKFEQVQKNSTLSVLQKAKEIVKLGVQHGIPVDIIHQTKLPPSQVKALEQQYGSVETAYNKGVEHFKKQKAAAETATKALAKSKAAAEAKAAKFIESLGGPAAKAHYDVLESIATGHGAEAILEAATKKAKTSGLDKYISNPEAAQIAAYTGEYYGDLNHQLRKGFMTEKQAGFAHALQAAILKLPAKPGVTMRGTTLPPDIAAQYQPGIVVTEAAFTSTGKGKKFSGDHTFEIRGRSGRDVSELSFHPSENEVLFPMGTRFKVLSRQGNHIVLEEVDYEHFK